MATELCLKCDKAPRSDPETLRSTQIKARKQSTFSNLAKKKNTRNVSNRFKVNKVCKYLFANEKKICNEMKYITETKYINKSWYLHCGLSKKVPSKLKSIDENELS